MKKYLYVFNYPRLEEDICLMEMRTLFEKDIIEKEIFSNKNIDVSDSVYINFKIEILHMDEKFENIVEKIKKEKIIMEEFKVEYYKIGNDTTEYAERIKKTRSIGLEVQGEPNMKNPKTIYGIVKVKDIWILGVYKKNNFLWNSRVKKPMSYSNSLGVSLAKSVINLATCGDKNISIIDPCCGIGTILIEACKMNVNIEGYEINKKIYENAKINLKFYNCNVEITNGDMHEIAKKYDSSILDIPYGIFSHITKEEQQSLINKTREISKRLILISFEDLDYMIEKAEFKIIDRCEIPKGNFKRYIYICK